MAAGEAGPLRKAIEERLLLEVGQDGEDPAAAVAVGRPGVAIVGIVVGHAVGKGLVVDDVAGEREPDLLEVVAALDAAGRLPDPLHSRQEQRDQQRDDRDHHEHFDERETM